MLYLFIWFTQGILNFLFKLFLIFFCFFLSSTFSHIINNKKYITYFPWFFFPVIYYLQPHFIFFIFSLFIYLTLILIIKNTHSLKLKTIFWLLNKEALKRAIKIREILFISDWLYFFLSKIKNFVFFFFIFLLFVIFASYHQLFILIALSFLTLSAILMGLSLGFFSNLLSLLFTGLAPSEPPEFASFPLFLKHQTTQHPLNAIVEESFFEDNLQIGEFFLVYPIFFKASHPSPNLLSYEQEIINVWHLIRWESALSKQTGSAASRWSSLFTLSSMPPQSRIHSIHTPLIPIFREELFSLITSNNLPFIDPFNQPPNWRPYLIITHFLNWKEDDINEERINEIEEEE